MSTTTPLSAESSAERVLVLTRVYDAPRHVVFEAWTKGEHIAQWCAPKGFTIPESKGDIRPGGKWRSCMRSPQGDEYCLGGVYLAIEEDELVSFTHAWEEENGSGPETTVTVRFADQGSRTMLFFEQGVFSSIESRDSHEGGWNECLDRLADYLVELAPLEVVHTRVIAAPRARVFRAWTDPLEIAAWWGPKGFSNPVCHWEAKPGGLIHIDMRGPDGTIYPMSGVVQEVSEPTCITFTSAALDGHGITLFEVFTSVTLAELEGKTTLHLHAKVIRSTPAAVTSLSGMKEGWAQSLDRLEALVTA